MGDELKQECGLCFDTDCVNVGGDLACPHNDDDE
jgi:hypothetical protein